MSAANRDAWHIERVKIKFAAMHINERLNQVGLKLAFARKRSDSKPTVKTARSFA